MNGDEISLVRVSVNELAPTAGWLGALLGRQRLPHDSVTALRVDTEHIIQRLEDHLSASQDGFVSGLVVGAVQSGKTASMLAVAAAAIDASFDVIVLVSGTKVALWRQTRARASNDLDGLTDENKYDRGSARYWVPSPPHNRDLATSPSELYESRRPEGRRHLAGGRPVVVVAMKQGDHLAAVARNIRGLLSDLDRPKRMLVIDDEADDGSILNADTVGADDAKLIPRQIAALWSGSDGGVRPFLPLMKVAYLAYTATPQANLLQYDHNPLSPRDFVTAIRTPSGEGSPSEREKPTYKASNSLRDWYTGGTEFYPRETAGFQPCIPLKLVDPCTDVEWKEFRIESLGEALRAFIVASACRILEANQPPSAVANASFPTREKAADNTPPICSMLFNPGCSVDTHFDGELAVRDWLEPVSDPLIASLSPARTVRPTLKWMALKDRIPREEPLWRSWHEKYQKSAQVLHARPEGANIKAPADWPTVLQTIFSEVLPNMNLHVVNSADEADSSPDFGPQHQPDGSWRPTNLICSVFIAGNVMSRGLTLEGLTTTLFLRNPLEPVADTQVQMQRWLGYRGAYLHYCRVFLLPAQLARFREYHDDDEALRREIFEQLKREQPNGARPQVLCGVNYRATGKVQNVHKLPLCPGAAPFVQLLWDAPGADPNVDEFVHYAKPLNWHAVQTQGTTRGIIADRQLSLSEAATLLDLFKYKSHDPSAAAEWHVRWNSLHATMGLPDSQARFFRPEALLPTGEEAAPPTQCPYTIAAYFRFWQECETRAVPGLAPTDLPGRHWSHLSHEERKRRTPKFWLGIKFGEIELPAAHPLTSIGADLGIAGQIKLMKRKIDASRSELAATWGSRNSSGTPGAYLGDQYFDYHRIGCTRRPAITNLWDAPWRNVGEDGLILVHIVDAPDGPRLAAGVCIPAGGPDQICVLRPVGH